VAARTSSPARADGDRRKLPPGARWALWLVLGVAATGVAGYLVAALVFFPAPLLPNERQVARVTGLNEAEARRDLERQGLLVEVAGREPNPNVPRGAVVWQDPPPGVAVPRGSTVQVALSAGEPRIVVPDVRGFDADFAQRMLTAIGLRVDGVDSVDTKDLEPGAASGTEPAAGDSVVIGRSIFLHLAK